MLRTLFAVILAVVVASPLRAQQEPAGLDDELLRRIRAGDASAFTTAGATGDAAYTPYLLRALRDPKIGFSFALARSLAVLDESSMQQRIWCESIRGDEPVTAMTEYSWIGGWYGVRALLAIADGAADANFELSRERLRGLDDPPPKPSWFALVLLPNVVPGAGIGVGTVKEWESGVTKKRWADWISAHLDEMRVRPPVGAAVDLTVNACGMNGRPLKKR